MGIANVLFVPLVRILVDGYSLLHGWPDLAPGQPRHSQAAREELVYRLTQYRDAVGTPITVFFDGARAPGGVPKNNSTPEVEILFSKAGQTADDMIERTAHRMRPYGDVLVVTNDFAERDTVIAFGCHASSCDNFIRLVDDALQEMSADVKHYNRQELNRYKNS